MLPSYSCSLLLRYHYSSYNVHHHHWCQCLHATCVVHQSSGHLPVGQLCVRVPLCYWVCSCQLLDHRAGAHREEAARASECTHSITLIQHLHTLWHNKQSCKPPVLIHIWYLSLLMIDRISTPWLNHFAPTGMKQMIACSVWCLSNIRELIDWV